MICAQFAYLPDGPIQLSTDLQQSGLALLRHGASAPITWRGHRENTTKTGVAATGGGAVGQGTARGSCF